MKLCSVKVEIRSVKPRSVKPQIAPKNLKILKYLKFQLFLSNQITYFDSDRYSNLKVIAKL